MKTFQEMIGPDCGRDIDRQIRTIIDQIHRNAEQLCKEDFDRLALANGYVKAEDYEALKAKVAELTDLLEDATSTLDQIEAESACFDGLARSAGYIKLEPGQVVVDAKSLFPFIDDRCRECSNRNICRSGEFACKLQSIYDAIKGGYHE